MQGPRPARWRKIPAGRAVFNAAAELCRVKHPAESYHNGDSACGECHSIMAWTINNPANKRRAIGWGTWVLENLDTYGRLPTGLDGKRYML